MGERGEGGRGKRVFDGRMDPGGKWAFHFKSSP